MEAAGYVRFHYDALGIVGVFADQNNHDIAFDDCLLLPLFVRVCLVERAVADAVLGMLPCLFVEVVF